jgi:hypothetical protein
MKYPYAVRNLADPDATMRLAAHTEYLDRRAAPHHAGRSVARVRGRLCCWLGLPVVAALAVKAAPLAAQEVQRQNVYRYVLDVEPPEPAGFVPLDLGTRRVYRATGPKPIAAAVLASAATGDSVGLAASLEFSPYYLLGGGTRTLASYRDNSVAGRLRRIVTKTLIGVAVAHDPSLPGATRLGLALRATFHDPHDVTSGYYGLAERVDSALAAHDVHPAAEVDDVTGLGVDLAPIFADARRAARARCCVQVSGGYGFAALAQGGRLAGDSIGPLRHTLWVSAQWTLSPKLDLLVLLQGTNAFRSDWHQRLGVAFERKASRVDLLGELYFDSEFQRLYPGLTVEAAVAHGLALDAGILAESGGADASPRLRSALMLRWMLAHAR